MVKSELEEAKSFLVCYPDVMASGLSEWDLLCLIDAMIWQLTERHDWTDNRVRQAIDNKIDAFSLIKINQGEAIIKEMLGSEGE